MKTFPTDEMIEKAMQARVSMWSFIGDAFGFIIAAASIVSTISTMPVWLLPCLLISSFSGVGVVFRCFYLHHRFYINFPEEHRNYTNSNPEEREIKARELVSTPHPVKKWEQAAFICLGISAVLFFVLAVLGARTQWESQKANPMVSAETRN